MSFCISRKKKIEIFWNIFLMDRFILLFSSGKYRIKYCLVHAKFLQCESTPALLIGGKTKPLNPNHTYNHHILATLVPVYLCSPVSLAPFQILYRTF